MFRHKFKIAMARVARMARRIIITNDVLLEIPKNDFQRTLKYSTPLYTHSIHSYPIGN